MLSFLALLSIHPGILDPSPPVQGEPPNAPAVIAREGDQVTLRYQGRVIFFARTSVRGTMDVRVVVDTSGGAVTQVIKWTARGDGARIVLTGQVEASDEAFPVEAEPRPEAIPLVRNAVGLSRNRLNRAVYDRQGDWLLSVDVPAKVVLDPESGRDRTVVRLEASGFEVALRFRPRFYGRHRGLARFAPWTYRVRRESMAGWTSWFAFLDTVSENHIRRTATTLGMVLRPFGYTVLQIDDGYQRLPIGLPSHWLQTNEKFPSGLAGLRRAIAEAGLLPGIWTNTTFHDRDWALAHPQFFLTTPEGGPAYGNWVGYVMDGANPATLDSLVHPVYRQLAQGGWGYFKVDALRHLRYEGFNSFAEDFRRRGLDREQVYRDFVAEIRRDIGPAAYLLACWGIRPELVGLVDAVRVGTDGFGYAGFAQYNSWNNVVWRNDPDHIEIAKPDGYRAATLASLTGSLLMLTDPPEVYLGSRVEAAKRTAQVLFTLPQQVYDVDPSRSSLIAGAATETSGSGPRPFDADRTLAVALYLLDITRPFERWSVLARTGGSDSVRFRELGLADDREQLVFEFWTKALRGAYQGGFVPGQPDPRFGVQVFCLRERQSHPQLVATSRHVSCGGPDLAEVSWDGATLSGTSDLVGGDGYDIYVTEPAGWTLVEARADSGEPAVRDGGPGLRVVRILAARGGPVSWRIGFRHAR